MSNQFAGSLIKDIGSALNQEQTPAIRALLRRVNRFLKNRLTEAAIEGCHHCDEDEPPAPCHWCGLKSTGVER